MKNQAERTTQDGLLELVGAPPIWIWAHPCRLADCDCRLVLVLATPEGRTALIERAAEVHKAWHEGTDCAQVASRLTDLVVFQVHIDSAEAFLLDAQTPLDLANHPQVRVVLDRLDGEVLDAIGHFYDRSRGKEDRAARVASAERIVLQGWSRGDMVEYGLLAGVRHACASAVMCTQSSRSAAAPARSKPRRTRNDPRGERSRARQRRQ